MATNTEWELISHEEAAGYYTDRILLALGPGKVIHHLPISSIRNTSVLLMNTARLPSPDRHLRLPGLDHSMLNLYVTMDSTAPFAKEHSWSDIIKLAITAKILQDPIVSAHAIVALNKKEELVVGGEGEPLSVQDYGIAWNFSRGGKGDWMLITLNNIRERQNRRIKIAQALAAPLLDDFIFPPPSFTSSPSQVPQPAYAPALPQPILDADNKETMTRTDQLASAQGKGLPSKYANSKLRGKDLVPKKKAEEGTWHACRQPIVPPSKQALQTGVVGNFVWPAPGDAVVKP